MKREDKEKPIPWEVSDPKPPVIRSGKMEDRVCAFGENNTQDQELSG